MAADPARGSALNGYGRARLDRILRTTRRAKLIAIIDKAVRTGEPCHQGQVAYHGVMTTRDDLYHLVDRIDPDDFDAAAAALLPYAEHQAPPMPKSLGLGHSGRGDVAEHSEELLAKTGFGQ